MFKNPFSFEGRIRRTEFGISYIVYIVISYFLQILAYTIEENGDGSTALNIFIMLFYIPLLWFLLAQGAKRCHDRGNSGWYQLIPFYVLWLIFGDSDTGQNEYGPNPKGIGNFSEINEIGVQTD